MAGAILGTSTTTTYVESASGIVAGARTGLANVVTGLLFLAALVVTPIIAVVPAFATAPALVVVGVFMFRNVARIDFRTGLAFGFIASVLFATGAGRAAKVHPVMWVIAALSALELALRS